MLCEPLLGLLLKETGFFLEKVPDILQKAFLVVEDVVLILDEGDPENVEDTFWTGQGFAAERVLREPLDQMVADFRVNKVLLSPLQADKLLLRRQVEIQ